MAKCEYQKFRTTKYSRQMLRQHTIRTQPVYPMLPHQSSDIHPGPQGHHQRHNSTTTDFDNLRISTSPRHAAHHRGLSYDQMMPCHRLPASFQEDSPINTNPKHMQHAIPETQPRPMARPGQRRNNSDDGTLRPFRFAPDVKTDTGCFKNNLSLAQINDMTDQDVLAFLSTRKDQSRDSRSLFATNPAGSLDGNGNQNSAIARAMQHDDAKEYKPPDSGEVCRRSPVQHMITGPPRPCTPPTQSNYCKNRAPRTFQSSTAVSNSVRSFPNDAGSNTMQSC